MLIAASVRMRDAVIWNRPCSDRAWSTAAHVMTLARLPLARAVRRARGDSGRMLAIMVLAGITDVLDGRLARHRSYPTPSIGVWLDPLCDKVFVLSAISSASRVRFVSNARIALILSREISQFSLGLLYMARYALGRVRGPINVRADWTGKAVTSLQFATLFAMLYRARWVGPLAGFLGIVGPLAAIHYYRRLSSLESPKGEEIPAAKLARM